MPQVTNAKEGETASSLKGVMFEATSAASPTSGILSLLPSWQQIPLPIGESHVLQELRCCLALLGRLPKLTVLQIDYLIITINYYY